jgi:cell division septation protein DedD
MRRHSRQRYVVVAMEEQGTVVPVVVGPFIDRKRAEQERDRWHGQDSGYTAHLAYLENGPAARRERDVRR